MVRTLTAAFTALLAIALPGVPVVVAAVALLYALPAHLSFPALPPLLTLVQVVPAAWGVSRVFGSRDEQ